jgi:phage regulator Rha-like protein
LYVGIVYSNGIATKVGDKHQSINQSINQLINSNQAYQHSVRGKNRERSLIKPDLKPMLVNSYKMITNVTIL